MMAAMTSEEFSKWRAFDRISPIGDDRADLRLGILCALIANCWLPRDDQKPWAPEDFMPFVEEDEASLDQMVAVARGIAR